MTMRSVAALLSAFAFEACAHEKVLEPAAGAPVEAGRPDAAETAVAGVTVEVDADSWKGDPDSLGTLFTPVRVTVHNDSGKPLLVSYRNFKLSGDSGSEYAAVAPVDASGTVDVEKQYTYGAGPEIVPVEPTIYMPVYDGLFEYSSESLPTQDMFAEALPESMVQNGGKVTGFVYFPSVTGRESTVELDMSLADARDGQAFGRIAIPFRITER